MINLKFLEVDNVIISSIPRILPNSLRIMKWNRYPSKYLPSKFQPNKLVSLEMWGSKLVGLWDKGVDLPNLKNMDLSCSRNLATTPNFTGIPKLQVLNLRGCENLVQIHPSIAFLKSLTDLILNGCKSVKSLPREVEMDSLIYFDVQGCSKLKKIPEFSGQMKNLSMLYLSGTPIEKLPSSIGRLVGLTFLDVGNCENLLGLPSEICNLKSLEVLYVDGCSYNDKHPENSQEMGELWSQMRLKFDSCSVGHSRCTTRISYPNKSRFWRRLQRKTFVMGSLDGLWSLKGLDLSDCGLCEGDIPVDICCLPFLEELNLSRNNFVSLPASIGCLSKLKSFWVNGCQRLQQLPHLCFGILDESCSVRFIEIYTDDCTSLKMLPKVGNKNGSKRFIKLSCLNCFGLVENEGCNDSQLLGMLRSAMSWRVLQVYCWPAFEIVIPGSRIPEWFNNQRVGDSFIVEIPPSTTPIWIALCAVIEEDYPNPPHDLSKSFEIQCQPFDSLGLMNQGCVIKRRHLVSPHLWVCCFSYLNYRNWNQMKISVETLARVWVSCGDSSRRMERIYWPGIKKCGFRWVHDEDLEELNQIMMMNHSINISTKATSPHNSADASASSHQKSLCRKSYALSKWFLTKLVKIFSLFLTTTVFIKSFNTSEQWGCIGLLIWRVTTLISYLGLAPSYFSLLLKSLIKTVILKRAAKFLQPLLKTPPPQMSTHKYLQG